MSEITRAVGEGVPDAPTEEAVVEGGGDVTNVEGEVNGDDTQEKKWVGFNKLDKFSQFASASPLHSTLCSILNYQHSYSPHLVVLILKEL